MRVSQTSENLVAICFASLAYVCLFWRLRHNPTLFCCVESPGVNSHTHQWSRCVLLFRLLLRLCFCRWQQREGHAPVQYKNAMFPHPTQRWCHTCTTHTLHMGTVHTHTHTHINKVFSSSSLGQENRNMLDVANFVVFCCYSWFGIRVCQTVYSNASGSSLVKCQFHEQSQTASDVFVSAEWSPVLSTVKVFKVGGVLHKALL